MPSPPQSAVDACERDYRRGRPGKLHALPKACLKRPMAPFSGLSCVEAGGWLCCPCRMPAWRGTPG